MKIFKDEPVLDSNGLYVYPPEHETVEREITGFTYNRIVLPPLPKA